jgi:serine/threonine protein kinase
MLQVGQILQERYQLKQQLGQNAGRQTWLAEDLAKQPAEPVIVKLLAFCDQVQWDNLKLFEREANVLKQLNHPQIPKYRDYFSIDDRILWFGLVQDDIPGSSLKQLLAQGRKFSEKEVRKIATDVLQVLTYLHELSPTVLHRDIKPSNLILGQDEKIYLVDFGAVQDRAATEGATFTVVGTYGYAPMEQFGGRAVPASDLYALGGTLIHLLTGTAPADLPQRNMRIQFSDKVSLSPNFVNWIEVLTQPDVEQRFSTARQALEALRKGNTANSSVLTSKPYGSRIQLNKSFSQLEIKIPRRGLRFSDTFSLLFAIIWYGGIIHQLFLHLCLYLPLD